VIHANLLIADDEPLVRLDLRDLLTRNGHTVVGEASSGEEALALARSLRPDAVILDVVLPHHLSGLDVARALGGGRIAPVVVVTGHANPEVVEKANEAGVLGFLCKPFRPEDLLPAIAIAIARFQELVALESEIRSLSERMEARKLVGRAKALLMERHGLQEREAFRRIQAQSLATGRPVHEIAQAIITASEIGAA
jgi:response regulator NasT